ncbi:phospholipase, partial [Halorubrum tibetense]
MRRGFDRSVWFERPASIAVVVAIAALVFVAVLAVVAPAAAASPAVTAHPDVTGPSVVTPSVATTASDVTTMDPDVASDGSVATSNGSAARSEATPAIVELYPNPVTEGNRGEYLVVRLPSAGNWSLSDGHHTTAIPSGANGTVALSMAPELAADHLARAGDGQRTGVPVHALEGYFPLAAAGDRIELRRDGEAVD